MRVTSALRANQHRSRATRETTPGDFGTTGPTSSRANAGTIRQVAYDSGSLNRIVIERRAHEPGPVRALAGDPVMATIKQERVGGVRPQIRLRVRVIGEVCAR